MLSEDRTPPIRRPHRGHKLVTGDEKGSAAMVGAHGGLWLRPSPGRSRSRARSQAWPKCPTRHSRRVAFGRSPHRLQTGHGPFVLVENVPIVVGKVGAAKQDGSPRLVKGTVFERSELSGKAHLHSGGGSFCFRGGDGGAEGVRRAASVDKPLPIKPHPHRPFGVDHPLHPRLDRQVLLDSNTARENILSVPLSRPLPDGARGKSKGGNYVC